MRRVESRRHGVSSGHLTTAGPRGGAPAARPVGAATAASAPAASVGRWSRRTRPGRGRGCRRPRRAGVGRPMARRTVLNVQRPRNHLLRHAFHQMQVADLGPLGRPDRSPPASSRLSRRGGHVSPPSIFARRLLLPGAQGVPFRLAARVPFHVAAASRRPAHAGPAASDQTASVRSAVFRHRRPAHAGPAASDQTASVRSAVFRQLKTRTRAAPRAATSRARSGSDNTSATVRAHARSSSAGT